MKKLMLIALCVLVFAASALAQYTQANTPSAKAGTGPNPTYSQGAVGLQGIDKLGAHQNGGRGCVGCHAPHSGARGNGGNSLIGSSAVTDPDTGNYALWGQDLTPLYAAGTLKFGGEGAYDITFGTSFKANDEQVVTGVMMCLSCHDGNIAKGAMMANQSYEQAAGLLPSGYGSHAIPTLLGSDGTAAGNYENDHPIGPKANMAAVGLYSSTPASSRIVYAAAGCTSGTTAIDCILPNTANAAYVQFVNNYGSFNVSMKKSDKDANGNFIQPLYLAGGRANPLVLPTTNAGDAYVVCTTCHTPHTMYVFSGNAGVNGAVATATQVLPSYFFIAAPYNTAAPIPDGTKASSATQFCRQCHFTGAGGSNEGSGINNVRTAY